MEHKPQWMLEHEEADNARFREISGKLDSILEVMTAFKLGGRGLMWAFGLIIAIGSSVVLVMQIFHK